MAGITGIGSGMDIKGMVEAIVSAEQAPKAGQLTKLESKTTTQLTSLGQLKSAISKFQTALSALNSPSSFLARAANSSDTKVLTVSANQSAQAGSYKINVQQLASGSKVALAAIASDAKLNTGSVTIKVGDGVPLNIAVDASNNSLEGIRDAINEAGKSQGLSSTIVTDDQGARIVLSSTKAGEGNDITVTVDETGVEAGRVSLNQLAYSGPTTEPSLEDFASAEDPEASFSDAMAAYEKGGQTLAIAQSAKLTIDGLAVTRDSNSISDVVGGLSFELKGIGSSDLVVTKDEAGVETNVKNFVDAYNALMSFINTETKVTTVNDSSAPVTGALVGDASVRALVNSVRSELVSPQGQGTVRALADMGITTKKDGTLEMNSDKIKKAISEDFEGVAAYFTNDTGLAGRLGDRLKPYTDGGGILASRTDALQKTIEKVDKQKVDLTTRMKALEDRLYKQYNAMDSLVSQLMKTSDSLTQLFDSMPGFVTQKN
ncbi:flagellar filament capping protein FliD [Stutzerimonas frequens]|uniref:flagellar filament capping protein FliD n=1 Tax=Stutzerimonas frequens TaxID=2968969 RepID=UPI0025549E70|nr:flagellar filament capping protein FliD [Stutzerimonas frequens]MDL0440829.1 flagellar filament capping protein FliD [Stutzerimonas frequens]